MSVHIFGVRHHGPGCARSQRAARAAHAPDIVLVEGPPEGEAVLPLIGAAGMEAPVALLLYAPDAPHRAVYYPFAVFSPEWQALTYARERGIPARFMDLPQAIQLAARAKETPENERESEPEVDAPEAAAAAVTVAPPGADPAPAESSDGDPAASTRPTLREDPIGLLAEAAGYADHELWWEQQIEQRVDATDLFAGIMEAMTALRADAGAPPDDEAKREAHMRQTIRAAEAEGFARIAVVCGAWHAPALARRDPASDAAASAASDAAASAASDAALLAGLPRAEVAATWIPWTYSRLSYRTGYGAGIASPGWYAHLWTAPDRVSVRWLAHVARLLRGEDLDASSASVIEAARLAEALAALRGLPMPGLAELNEAALTALCHGEAAPMRLIHEQLEIGEAMGAVPPETPGVPLQRDVERAQHRLHLAPSVAIAALDLDLRKETDRARSQLLHRLRLLGIPWGTPQHVGGSKLGTFHELWQLQWQVEFAVKLIEANIWGNTVATAATGYVRHLAEAERELPGLTELLDGVILAELPAAADHLLARINAQAAVAADVRHLMDALPPLARVARYGDVRGTRGERVLPVIEGLFARALVGLPGASGALDDDAAHQLVASIDHAQESLNLLDRADLNANWHDMLGRLVARDGAHGLVRGRACRLLLEQHILDDHELQRLARLALAPVVPAEQAGAWVEGLLYGSGLLLLHQDGLWLALDAWLRELAPETFVALLPLLRRTFAAFPAPERRQMGERLKRLGGMAAQEGGMAARRPDGADGGDDELADLDRARADLVLPVLTRVLGVEQ
jgi:hypothetical protein